MLARTDIRWKRIFSMAVAMAAVARIVVVVTSAPRTIPEEQIKPVPAPPNDHARILAVLVKRYAGMGRPLPPPEPGRLQEERPLEDLVLLSATVKLCETIEGASTHHCPEHGLLERVPSRLVRELVLGNDTPRMQPSGILGVTIVEAHVIEAVFSEGWWPEFHRRFPRKAGILSTSWSVLSDTGMSAVVYVSLSCGGLCGTGDVVLLSREGTEWKIVAVENIWVS